MLDTRRLLVGTRLNSCNVLGNKDFRPDFERQFRRERKKVVSRIIYIADARQ